MRYEWFKRPLMAVVAFLKFDLYGALRVGQLFRCNFIFL